jgi:hypothetical protein
MFVAIGGYVKQMSTQRTAGCTPVKQKLAVNYQ